ncbi:unnamed protein product [Malus baccata var. baccata]
MAAIDEISLVRERVSVAGEDRRCSSRCLGAAMVMGKGCGGDGMIGKGGGFQIAVYGLPTSLRWCGGVCEGVGRGERSD